MSQKAPLSDVILVAVSKLVDDAQSTREPSHSEIEFQINRSGLSTADPKSQGQNVGKAKRVRATLNWALEHDLVAGETLVANLISLIKGCGGFRPSSPNYVGVDLIGNAIEAFKREGFLLSSDGELTPLVLDNLSGKDLSAALRSYVKRAQRGADDAALVTGTGKDLVEATAAHILVEKWGTYSASANFPALLGQAFVALNLKTPQHPLVDGEPPAHKLERALYEAACAVNTLRNKQGTGHGRPWLPTVTPSQARLAIQVMGAVSELLLDTHESNRG